MRKNITQEMPYGCGIACFAFVCNISYKKAETFLGQEQANSDRFIVKHFRDELNRFGLHYTSQHVKPMQTIESVDGVIVLLRRSKAYPVGHYLVYHQRKWMDPYYNLTQDHNFHNPNLVLEMNCQER